MKNRGKTIIKMVANGDVSKGQSFNNQGVFTVPGFSFRLIPNPGLDDEL